MNVISLSLDEFAHLHNQVSPFFSESIESGKIVEDALKMTKIPETSVIDVESKAKTIWACIDEFWDEKSGPLSEMAAQRRAIFLAKNTNELVNVHRSIIKDVAPENGFENKLLVRRFAELLFV